jgi:hypothetical protein
MVRAAKHCGGGRPAVVLETLEGRTYYAATGTYNIDGIIVKARIGGDQSGTANPDPVTNNAGWVSTQLNAMGVNYVRVQVNDTQVEDPVENDRIIAAGDKAINKLAENGFNGKVLIDAKKWDLWDTALRPATNRTRAGEWAYQITQTWKGMTAGGLARFGGVSFGESNPDNRDWGKHAEGIRLALANLKGRLPAGAMNGKLVMVPGAGYNGDYANFNQTHHNKIAAAVHDLGANLVYGVKTFYSLQSALNASGVNSVAERNTFLRTTAGLQKLENIQTSESADSTRWDDFDVTYMGNASDDLDSGNKKTGLLETFAAFGWDDYIASTLYMPANSDLFNQNGSPITDRQSLWQTFFG